MGTTASEYSHKYSDISISLDVVTVSSEKLFRFRLLLVLQEQLAIIDIAGYLTGKNKVWRNAWQR